MDTFRCITRLLAAGVLCLLTSGCILEAIRYRLVFIATEEQPRTVVDLEVRGGTGGICRPSSAFGYNDCLYIVTGQEIGSGFGFTGEYGLLEAIIDPIVLQLPVAATAFSGTFTGPGGTANLVLVQATGAVRADLRTSIVPEPGMKLVVIDFPANPPAQTMYDFTLRFELPGNVTSVPVKVLAAAKLNAAGQTFYTPLLPCETQFVNIPGVTLAQSATFQTVTLPSPLGLGCGNRLYDFRIAQANGAQEIPSLGAWGMALLTALVGGWGMLVARRRRI